MLLRVYQQLNSNAAYLLGVLTVFLKAPAAGSKGLKKKKVSLAALILKNLCPSIKKVPWMESEARSHVKQTSHFVFSSCWF